MREIDHFGLIKNGIIEKRAPEFCESYVIGRIPVIRGNQQTLFTRTGDIAGIAEISIAVFILIMQSFIVIIKSVRNK